MTDNEVRKLQEERSKAIINIWITQTIIEMCEDSPEITPEQIKASKGNIESWSKRAAEIEAILTRAQIEFESPEDIKEKKLKEAEKKENNGLIQSIKPTLAIINNSLVDNKLMEIEQASKCGKSAAVKVDKGGKGSIKTIAFLSYDDENITITGRPLTPFDQTVHNAICSIWEAGNLIFVPEMVYRAMNGLTDSERIVEERGTLEPIIESIEAGRFRLFKVDAEEQIKKYYPSVKKAIYENYFLPLEKTTIILKNGETKEAYRFSSAPPLYEYSKNIKQVISVPIKLLDSRETLKNSPTIAVMREYLIKRISNIKNDKASVNNANIKYSTIFANTGIDESNLSYTQRNRKREQIKKILEHFKNQNFIKSYAEYKKGRTFKGVKIYF